MFFVWKDLNIFYNIKGKKGKWLLFLHGWGGNHQSFAPLYKNFPNYKILTIDFPPFGQSSTPQNMLSMNDYAEMVFALLKFLKIRKIKILAHSFGGRVAILLASRYNIVTSLILADSAGIKPRKSIATKFKIFKYKFFKKLGIKQNGKGSSDYRSLSPIMQKTFVCVVNTFLNNDCKNIKCPCLIAWGEKDYDTPLYMAKKLSRLIENSRLVIFKNVGHFAYLDRCDDFCKLCNDFLIRG